MSRLAIPVILLLLVPVAHAQAPVLAELDVRLLQASGTVDVAGEVLAWRSTPLPAQAGPVTPPGAAPDPDRVPPSSLNIAAPAIRVETDMITTDLTLLGAGVLPGRPTSSTLPLEAAQLRMADARPTFSYVLMPLAGHGMPALEVTGTAASTGPFPQDEVRQEKLVSSDRPVLSVRTTDASVFDTAGWHQLTVRGAFVLVAWEMDFHARAADGTHEVRTGAMTTPLVPAPEGAVATRQERQAYIFVENGTLTATFQATAAAQLVLNRATVTAEGGLALQSPRGQLYGEQGPVEVAGQRLDLQGRLDASLGPAGPGRLSAVVHGSEARAQLDGREIALAAEIQPSTPSWTPWILAGAAALAIALVAGRRWQLRARMRAAQGHMDEGEYGRVAKLARSLIRVRRFRQDAVVMRTVALLQTGRLTEAEEILGRWPGGGNASVRHYLRAHLHAMRGDWDKASASIDVCLEGAPSMIQEVAANPLFSRLGRGAIGRRLGEGYA